MKKIYQYKWLPLIAGLCTLVVILTQWQALRQLELAHDDIDAVTKIGHYLSTVALTGGVLLSLFLTLAMYFAQKARLRQKEVEEANRKLVGEAAERKNLEEQLLQSQKMEAVGQLTGGIAHEFNNILATINGYAEFTLMKMKDGDQFRRNLEEIAAAGEKAANLVRSIMTFSRKHEFSPTPQDLNWIILTLKNTLLRLLGEDVTLNISIANKDLIVLTDSSQIEQVLINLALNARDAMPGGGVLSITTEFVEFAGEGDHPVAPTIDRDGAHALITVSDTGAGMDKKTRERVFEPFFTTKEVGEGTGLDLSVVYGIIKQHNGCIDLYSEPGAGTTFKIYLPLTDRKAEAEKQRGVIAHARGIETVLVAEDEAAIRQFTSILLKEFGYDVIEAVDGNDAVNKFVENKDRIDLVLLDVIMPNRNGKEVYEEIKRVRPDMKVVFMSGYTADIISKRGIGEGGFSFAPKPISPDVLLNKVREALDNE